MEAIIVYNNNLPDAAQIYQFYLALGWEPELGKTPEQLFKAMQGSWYLICAWHGETLIGMARVVSDGYLNTYLCGLGVLPDYRHQGIGTKLTQMVIKACEDEGLKPQFFCEEHLIPFYEKMGFSHFAAGMKKD